MSYNTHIKNVTFKDTSLTYLIQMGTSSEVTNSSIIDSTVNYVTKNNGYAYNTFLVKDMNLSRVTVKSAVTNDDMGFNYVTFENINFTNCNISKFFSNGQGATVHCTANDKFLNINFIDCNITNDLFRKTTSNNKITFDKLVFDTINIIDCNLTGGSAIFVTTRNSEFNNVYISNLNNSVAVNIFSFSNTGHRVNNIIIDSANPLNYLINSLAYYELNGLSCSNVNVSSLVNTLYEDMNINGLYLTDVNFTSDVIATLPVRVSIGDSNCSNVSGHFIVDGSSVKVMNSNFTGFNNTGMNGGVFYLTLDADFFKTENVRFTNNTADHGGAIYVENDVLRSGYYNTIFTDNQAKNLGSPHEYNYSNDNMSEFNTGGAIYFNHTDQGNVIVTMDAASEDSINMSSFYYNNIRGNITTLKSDVYVVYNSTEWGGSGSCLTLDNAGDFMKAFSLVGDNGRIHFVNSTELYNFTTLYGSTYSNKVIPFDPDMMSYNITFLGNDTRISNLGLWIPEGNVMSVYNITLMDMQGTGVIVNGSGDSGNDACIFVNCGIINCGGSDVKYGAGMQINTNNTQLINVSFINNHADDDFSLGGGLYVNASNVSVSGCTFEDNGAGSGSHIYITSGNEFITITDSTFHNAIITAAGDGSGVSLNGGTMVVLSGCNFTSNDDGAALNLRGNYLYLTVVGNNFTDNKGRSSALFISDLGTLQNVPLNLTNNYFSGNNATNGGALFLGNVITPESLLLDGSVFKGNNATQGGALYINGSDFTLSSSRFIGNNATRGGAVYVNVNGTRFNYCNFTSNNANVSRDSYGSAIYVADNTGVSIENCRVENNRVFGGAQDLHADVSYDGILPSTINVLWGDAPYKQYANNRTAATVYYDLVYVAMINRGQGYDNSTATTMDKALDGILPNGVIVICDDNYIMTSAEMEKLTESNLTNVTFRGLTSKTTIKRNTTQSDKYLFNQPKKH